MINSNPFYKKNTKVKLAEIVKLLNNKFIKNKNLRINDIKELDKASSNDITFFNSSKYYDLVHKTRSNFIITNYKLKKLIPSKKNLITGLFI